MYVYIHFLNFDSLKKEDRFSKRKIHKYRRNCDKSKYNTERMRVCHRSNRHELAVNSMYALV